MKVKDRWDGLIPGAGGEWERMKARHPSPAPFPLMRTWAGSGQAWAPHSGLASVTQCAHGV